MSEAGIAMSDREYLKRQATWLAFDLWSSGITGDHSGECIYRDTENAPEGGYENQCEQCVEELDRVSKDLVARGWRKSDG